MTGVVRLYSSRCLPRTFHYTWVCLTLTSAQSSPSNDSALGCRFAFIRWSCLLAAGSLWGQLPPPSEKQVKNKFHKHPNKNRDWKKKDLFLVRGKRDGEFIWSGVVVSGEKVGGIFKSKKKKQHKQKSLIYINIRSMSALRIRKKRFLCIL